MIRLIALVCFLLVGLLVKPITWGFSLSRYRLIPTEIEPAGSFPHELKSKTWKLYAQGGQSYVFVSGDYVLKFFKDEPRAWVKWPSYQALKAKKLKRTLNGYSLIYSRCPDLSGIVCIHTARNSPIPATLVDRIGVQNKVDLNDYLFVLQRKAEELPLPTSAHEVAALVQELASHQLQDHDPRLHLNLGILDGRLIVLDPGRIVDEPNPNPTLPDKFLEFLR